MKKLDLIQMENFTGKGDRLEGWQCALGAAGLGAGLASGQWYVSGIIFLTMGEGGCFGR